MGAHNKGFCLHFHAVDVQADLVGFEIPDEFVVGYGIDYAQRNRNLPYIGVVRFNEDD